MTVQITPEPGLYVTATPIGNLKDITLRAIETMRAADLILCEDKRVTARLCQAHGIETPLMAYHDHNGAQMRPVILDHLGAGKVLCLVSDAGTPLISDPGYKLVQAVREAGHTVFTVPGPSALTAALSIAGVPTDRFLFAGFLPPKAAARAAILEELAPIRVSLVFYETGPRLAASLEQMAVILGPRKGVVARELTKLHEEVVAAPLAVLAKNYRDKPPKGELAILVEPPEDAIVDEAEAKAILTRLLTTESLRDAARLAAAETGLPKKQLYDWALGMKAGGEDDRD